ncbi:hypothetical protein D3C81_2108430 [compost metagenome]
MLLGGVADTTVPQKEAPIDSLLRELFQKKDKVRHQIQDDPDAAASHGQPTALLPCDE